VTSPGAGVRPALSVVIAAHDAAPWIEELLESIRAQRLAGLEAIVVENGSGDGTADRVVALAAGDPALRLVRTAATSAAAARNLGVEAATGEYLVFADADDIVPDGAYRAMVDALEASRSDMAIGDHLKFSAHRTWSPTERWYSFEHARSGVTPAEVPGLLAARPCWNRMFRRSFWDRSALSFPDIPSVEDIEPMTRAFLAADSIDVVPTVVYLYRDRGDTSSLSRRADADVTVRYLEQELVCAELVRADLVLRRQHAEIVLDADGWAHLHRFLATSAGEQGNAAVARATEALLNAIPLDALDAVGPSRRALWRLVIAGDWAEARSFTSAVDGDPAEALGAWTSAISSIRRTDPAAAATLARDGLVPAFVNGADALPPDWFAEHLSGLGKIGSEATGSALVDAMTVAIDSADIAAIPVVSALRRVVPLVVDEVVTTDSGLVVAGPADLLGRGLDASVRLSGPVSWSTPVLHGGASGGWRAEIAADPLPAGRYTVTVVFGGADGAFPVVTARMPLPPVAAGSPLQPLADRRDGWRFLVDRRVARTGISGTLAKVLRKFR